MFDESMGSEKEAKDQFSKKSKIYNESTFLFFNTYYRVHLFDNVVLAFFFFFC